MLAHRLQPLPALGHAASDTVGPVTIAESMDWALASVAALLFGLIDPNAPYWAFGFPAAITSVFGADFVFAAGTLFIAKISKPHEQSVSGGLFQTMIQVCAVDAR